MKERGWTFMFIRYRLGPKKHVDWNSPLLQQLLCSYASCSQNGSLHLSAKRISLSVFALIKFLGFANYPSGLDFPLDKIFLFFPYNFCCRQSAQYTALSPLNAFSCIEQSTNWNHQHVRNWGRLKAPAYEKPEQKDAAKHHTFSNSRDCIFTRGVNSEDNDAGKRKINKRRKL